MILYYLLFGLLTFTPLTLKTMTKEPRQPSLPQVYARVKASAAKAIQSKDQGALATLFSSSDFLLLRVSPEHFINTNYLLHAAVKTGDVDIVKWLFTHKANPNQQMTTGSAEAGASTPLWIAVKVNHVDTSNVIEELVAHPEIDPSDVSGCLAASVDLTEAHRVGILLRTFIKLIEDKKATDMQHVLLCNILLINLHKSHVTKMLQARKAKTKDRMVIIQRYLIHTVFYLDQIVTSNKSGIESEHIHDPAFKGITPLGTMRELGCANAAAYLEKSNPQFITQETTRSQETSLLDALHTRMTTHQASLDELCQTYIRQKNLIVKTDTDVVTLLHHTVHDASQARKKIIKQEAFERDAYVYYQEHLKRQKTSEHELSHQKATVHRYKHAHEKQARMHTIKKGITLRKARRLLAIRNAHINNLQKKCSTLKEQHQQDQDQLEAVQAYGTQLLDHINHHAALLEQQTKLHVDRLQDRLASALEQAEQLKLLIPTTGTTTVLTPPPPILQLPTAPHEEEDLDEGGELAEEEPSNQHIDVERIMLDAIVTALTDESNRLGLSLFYTALWYGMPDCVIDHLIYLFCNESYEPANPFIQHDGYNAFHLAAWFGRYNVLHQLLIDPTTNAVRRYPGIRLGDTGICYTATLYGTAIQARNFYPHNPSYSAILDLVSWYTTTDHNL